MSDSFQQVDSMIPGAIERGIYLVRTTPSLEPLVTAIMLDQIAGERSDLAMQMPEVDEVAVFCGGGAHARSRFQQMVTGATDQSRKLKFISLSEGIGSSPMALELLPTWMPNLDAAKKTPWWVVRHTHSGRLSPNFFRALGRFHGTMNKAETRGLLVFSTDDADDCVGLEHMVDEYLVATGCEDGLKSTKCISFECPSASVLSPFDSTKVMCVVSPRAGGLRFRFEPFVASELVVRVMARLRGAGRTYEEIGKIVKMDKSTVLRRLRGIRISPCTDDPQWLEAVVDHFSSEGA